MVGGFGWWIRVGRGVGSGWMVETIDGGRREIARVGVGVVVVVVVVKLVTKSGD